MKSITAASVILLLAIASASATPEKRNVSEQPYDIVLAEERVAFTTTEEMMTRHMRLLVRDLGVRQLDCTAFITGLSVVWDGKEYGFNARNGMGWSGPRTIIPKTTWGTVIDLSRYDILETALTVGKHTVAVRDAFAQLNAITIIIEEKAANKASEAIGAPGAPQPQR